MRTPGAMFPMSIPEKNYDQYNIHARRGLIDNFESPNHTEERAHISEDLREKERQNELENSKELLKEGEEGGGTLRNREGEREREEGDRKLKSLFRKRFNNI